MDVRVLNFLRVLGYSEIHVVSTRDNISLFVQLFMY